MLHSDIFPNSDWFEGTFKFKETILNINQYIDTEETERGVVINNYYLIKKEKKVSSYLAGIFSIRNISCFSPSPRNGGKFSIFGQFSDYLYIYSIPDFCGSTFQVETNFNCLNNICSDQTAEDGVSYYIYNNVKGSQASIATAASLVYRNYYLYLGSNTKINLIEKTSLPIKEGFSLLNEINFINDDIDPEFNYEDLDNYEIGIQENCQVILTRHDDENLTILPYEQIVHQVFVSSFNLSNNTNNSIKQINKIEPFLLKAEYKSTILAAWENCLKYPDNPGSNKCFLTCIGYELCNVPLEMIFNAIESCQDLIIESGLEVYLIPNDKFCYVKACNNLDQLVSQTSGYIFEP